MSSPYNGFRVISRNVHQLFDRVKGPVVKSQHRQKLSRYNGDIRRRRSWHFRFLLRGGAPIARHCYHILVYIPDLVVVLKIWYLF